MIRVALVLLVVLPQEVLPVVVPVRSPNGDVDVAPRRRVRLGAETDWSRVVELDKNDGALNPVVEEGVGSHIAHPGKSGLTEVLLNFFHPDARLVIPHGAHINTKYLHKALALYSVQLVPADACFLHDQIVSERRASQVIARFLSVHDGNLTLILSERFHEGQAHVLLLL